jgi:hypothetical protein
MLSKNQKGLTGSIKSQPVMKKTLPRFLIGAVVMLQLVWFVSPRSGSHPVSARVRQAFQLHEAGPKSELDAALAKAEAQDAVEAGRWAVAVLALVVGIDIALIYFFWNYDTRKTLA